MKEKKKDFDLIIEMYGETNRIFSIVEQKIVKLKKACQEFTQNNNNKIFVFCLDSLQFQCKFIDIECDDMKRLLFALNNRMYCEYYKLYKIILDYICKENIPTNQAHNSQKEFPIYKDLEPFKQYKLENIQELHSHIIFLLSKIIEYIRTKEEEHKKYRYKQELGFNMQNFVTTFNVTILEIKQKYELFVSYIDFFHSMHLKYLRRLMTKISLFESQLSKDIRLEDMFGFDNNANSENIYTFKEEEKEQKENNDEVKKQKQDVKNIFKSNVQKVINGIKMFGSKSTDEHPCDNISTKLSSSSSTSEMEDITKHICLELNELSTNVIQEEEQLKNELINDNIVVDNFIMNDDIVIGDVSVDNAVADNIILTANENESEHSNEETNDVMNCDTNDATNDATNCDTNDVTNDNENTIEIELETKKSKRKYKKKR